MTQPIEQVILAIDPGSRRSGFGVIGVGQQRSQYITSGCIDLTAAGEISARLDVLFSAVTELIAQYTPNEFAIEQVFMGRNAASALKLGQARGAAIVAATQAQLPVYEYAARQVKLSVVGVGQADKQQVQQMVMRLLSLPGLPQEDAADALAIALCHAQVQNQLARLGPDLSVRRGRAR